MKVNRNFGIKDIATILLFLFTAVAYLFDWWTVSLSDEKVGFTPLDLLDGTKAFSVISGRSTYVWVTIALLIVAAVIIHAVVCRILGTRYIGYGVPIAVILTLIAAVIISSKAGPGVSITAWPILSLIFASLGVVSELNLELKSKGVKDRTTDNIGTIRGIDGTYRDASFSISDGETLVFGRDPTICHIVFPEKNISREHCTIRYCAREKTYYVVDTSRNGTYFEDGVRLQPQREHPIPGGEAIYLDNPKEMFRLE